MNPSFDSQTKEALTTKTRDFKSSYEFSDKFMKELIKKSRIIEKVSRLAQAREENKMMRTLNQGQKKKVRLIGIPKLEDANDAGTKHGEDCTIILTEGDSAKSLALAGIEVIGRDRYGCFPLRGKFLNVKDAASNKIMENPEVQNIMKIIGLEIGKKYETTKNLRYGTLMIMTD